MWSTSGLTATRSTSSLPQATRPWTPPSEENSEYDPTVRSSTPPLEDDDDGSSQSSHLNSEPADSPSRPKLHTSATDPYLKRLASHTDDGSASRYFPDWDFHNVSHDKHDSPHAEQFSPHTPVRSPWSSDLLQNNSIPQYPYTPESMRTTASRFVPQLSPAPALKAWGTDSTLSQNSAVQHALKSCMTQLNNLIQSREPTEEQMEYLTSKFDEMARFLAAPDAQSKTTDECLFHELELSQEMITGLGITTDQAAAAKLIAHPIEMTRGYVSEVGLYIASVKKHAEDLKMRMDEVKQLNSIQLDIIDDLRRELKEKKFDVNQKKQEASNPNLKWGTRRDLPPARKSFWAAVTEALDAVGTMLHDE